MTVLNYIIADDIIKGISPFQQVSNGDGGKRVRFYIYTDRYPIVIETKNFYSGFSDDEIKWPETFKLYSQAYDDAAYKIAKLLDEEEALENLNRANSGKSKN